MRLTPEVPPMLQLRIVKLTLLTSLAFGAIATVFSAPLTAQTQQDLSTTIPNLRGYDVETRQSMEIACISEKTSGPVAYGACLNHQIASLQSSPGIRNLSGDNSQTRRTTSSSGGANSDKERTGRTDVHLSGHDSQTRQAALPTSRNGGANSDKSRTRGTAVHSVEELVPFIVLAIVLFIYLTPVIWVLLSGRSRGATKFGWLIVTVLFSWLGLAVFLIVTQATSNRPRTS
jgi:hypothetical protein